MKTKNKILIGIAAFVVVLCGIGGIVLWVSYTSGSFEPKALTVGTIWSDNEYSIALGKELDEFQHLFPHWKVTMKSYEPFQLAGGLQSLVGSLPDVFMVANPADLPETDYLTPPTAWTGESWALFYFKGALKTLAIGPEAPDPEGERWRQGKESLTDLRSLLGAVKAGGKTPISVGGLFGWPQGAWLQHLTALIRGPDAGAESAPGSEPLSSPMWAAALQEWMLWDRNGWINADWKSIDWPTSVVRLSRGEAFFALLGESLLSTVPLSRRKDVGMIPFPRGDSAPWVIGSVWYLAVLKNSASPIGSKQLYRYLTSPGVTRRLQDGTGHIFYSSETPVRIVPSVTGAATSVFIDNLIGR
jgi:hypothetical protein